MNAQHAATDLLDRQHRTTWAPAVLSGATGCRPMPSIDGRHVDAPIGTSHAWRDVITRATQVAASEATTCLQGESGTGKEVIARFIHQRSPRWRGPFIAINCAALPEQLLESELFGFERGAFTGAQQAKPGQMELAAGGVLFLDEVTEMAPTAQAKFLRVLQEREFLRLGGTRPVRVNVRVIAATNRNLDDAVADGEFRADLYYRLNVFDIHIPPLRERRDDIPVLAAGFLREFAGATTELTPQAMEALCRHDWPGNVRELRNVLERALIMGDGPLIDVEHLCLRARKALSLSSITDLSILEKTAIERAMRDADGNKVRAAKQLGISRMQLYTRLRKFGTLTTAKVLIAALAAALSVTATPAVAQDASDLAKQAQNPVASLISVPFQNNFNFEVGPREKMQDVLNIQPVIPFRVSNRWNVITRTIAPLIHQPELGLGIGNVSGLGDIQFSAFLSPVKPRGILWGVGPIVSLPTATDNLLGTEKLGIGPTGVALATHGPWQVGTLVNNVFSVAGAADRQDVNQMLVQPFVFYNMAGGWYFVSSPIITANWKADNDQRWTVPLGGGLGRIFRVGKQPLNTALEAFYHVEHRDGSAGWSLRLQTQLLFPK